MTREDAQTKARRLVSEGRVTIRRIGDDLIVAHVRGDEAEVYVVTWDPDGWSCGCPALGRCSHVRAVQLVTLTHDLEHAWRIPFLPIHSRSVPPGARPTDFFAEPAFPGPRTALPPARLREKQRAGGNQKEAEMTGTDEEER
jgi:hypothetical protein